MGLRRDGSGQRRNRRKGGCGTGSHLSVIHSSVSNGVRQGGVLSPLLFNLYIDDLSKKLNNCYLGCTVNDILINHLIYADDLVLLAPSAHALQLLVEQYLQVNMILYLIPKNLYVCVLNPRISNLIS